MWNINDEEALQVLVIMSSSPVKMKLMMRLCVPISRTGIPIYEKRVGKLMMRFDYLVYDPIGKDTFQVRVNLKYPLIEFFHDTFGNILWRKEEKSPNDRKDKRKLIVKNKNLVFLGCNYSKIWI